jgi:hypothetical protein
MLKKEVVDAVEKKQFHIYAIKTADEGINLLTGMTAGKELKSGKFSKGSFNAKVMEKLVRFNETLNNENGKKDGASGKSKSKR